MVHLKLEAERTRALLPQTTQMTRMKTTMMRRTRGKMTMRRSHNHWDPLVLCTECLLFFRFMVTNAGFIGINFGNLSPMKPSTQFGSFFLSEDPSRTI